MNQLFKVCSALLCLIISFHSSAQQKYSKTLLWRISGKGLQRPSYLYGTMHLTDKRIFRFGDSVYHAIEKCEGLAIELNPDEMAAYLINQAINEAESKSITEILDKKDYSRYSAALSKKFKKPADKITTADVVKEKNRWITEFLEKGEMPTFVDAWLYNFARKQGKWVGGVEDMADQSGLLEDLVDRSDIDYLLAEDSVVRKNAGESIDRLINLYINQDLDEIDNVMNTDFGRTRDRLLIKRNIKMARRIDSLMSFRNMFIAIGAAHLPGDSGVIDLLKARGFTVEPVFSKQKIDAQTYPVKTVNIPWKNYDDENKLYSISMPGNPASVKLYNMIEMKFYLDMSNMSAYCSMAVMNTNSMANKDSLLMTMARNMLRQEKVAPPKKVVVDGVEGSEFVKLEKGANFRIQAFIREKVVYVTFMYGLKKEGINSGDANKFFSSLVINKQPAATTNSVPFTDSIMGISFTAPVSFVLNNKFSFQNQNNFKITSWHGSNPSLGAYIMLFSKEVVPGYHLQGDSLVQAENLERMATVNKELKHQFKTIQGVHTLEYIGQNKEQEGIFYRAVSFVRNNKNLQFVVICDSSRLFAPEIEQMFNSLRFISPKVNWGMHTTPNGAISAWTPAPFQQVSPGGINAFAAYDTTTAHSYMVIPDTLSKYSWFNSDSSFWQYIYRYTNSGHTVISQSEIRKGAVSGKELIMTSDEDSTVYQRMWMVLVDSVLYKATLNGKKEAMYNANSERFFKEFEVHVKPTMPDFYKTSKAVPLLNDMASTDSLTRSTAWQFFESAPFEKTDIPLLRNALFRFYQSPYYGNDTASMINNAIARRLINLNDSTAVDLVRTQYPSLTGKKDLLKSGGLTLLAGLRTKESYSALAEFIQHPPAEGINYMVYTYLEDSLELTNAIYASLEKLFKDTAEITSIASLTCQLRDSGLLSREQLARYESDIIQAATRLLPIVKRSDTWGGVVNVVKLLGDLRSTAANNVLKSYLTVTEHYVLLEVVTQLVQNKQVVPATVLTKLAADKLYRFDLYKALQNLKRTDLFPKQYLTQAHFAAAAISNASQDDDYSADKITFLLTKTALYKGKRYVFYLYKVVYGSGESAESYLGIAGGYVGSGVEAAEPISGVYWTKAFDAKTVSADLAAYLKEWEGSTKEATP